MKWYIKCLRKYFDFKGRARRKEFWFFYLFNCIFCFIALLLDFILGWKVNEIMPIGYIYIIFSLVMFIPQMSVSVRRLHDVGKRGLWFFAGYAVVIVYNLLFFLAMLHKVSFIYSVFPAIISFAWIIWFLIQILKEGELTTNKYGENPKL